MTRNVYITIDVECSMGGAWGDPSLKPVSPDRAIMGRFGGQELGVPLIVDILEENGLRGTFFVEPFADEQGWAGTMEPICEYLLERGQDVQLHVHPNHKHYGLRQQGLDTPFTDTIAELSPDAQEQMLTEGADRLAGWTGRRPVAFRAGNMGASEDTLVALSRAGISIDSSYTPVFAGGQCRFDAAARWNGSKWYGDVLEVALSGYRQPPAPLLHPIKPLDVVSISFGEMRDGIDAVLALEVDAVVILHSFSLLKVRNVQYDGGRPDRIVTRRFRRLCRWLGREAGYAVETFDALAARVAGDEYEAHSAPVPRIGRLTRAWARKAVQGLNSLYWV
jgi:peptidoglycan/xylan/chitin deacetylase (PgdA/CDA1 family)